MIHSTNDFGFEFDSDNETFYSFGNDFPVSPNEQQSEEPEHAAVKPIVLSTELISAAKAVWRRRELARKRYQSLKPIVTSQPSTQTRVQTKEQKKAQERYHNNKPYSQERQRLYRQKYRQKIKTNFILYEKAVKAMQDKQN